MGTVAAYLHASHALAARSITASATSAGIGRREGLPGFIRVRRNGLERSTTCLQPLKQFRVLLLQRDRDTPCLIKRDQQVPHIIVVDMADSFEVRLSQQHADSLNTHDVSPSRSRPRISP